MTSPDTLLNIWTDSEVPPRTPSIHEHDERQNVSIEGLYCSYTTCGAETMFRSIKASSLRRILKPTLCKNDITSSRYQFSRVV